MLRLTGLSADFGLSPPKMCPPTVLGVRDGRGSRMRSVLVLKELITFVENRLWLNNHTKKSPIACCLRSYGQSLRCCGSAPGEAVCVGRREGCSPPGSGVKEAEGPVQRTVRQPSNTKTPGRRELVNVRDYEKSMCSHDTFLLDLIGVFHNNFFYSLEYRKDLESSID